MNGQYLTAFALYFLFLISIGLLSHRRQTTSSEFMVGNRSLNYWLTALSAHASDMSNWLFMAYPGTIFLLGPSGCWIAIGLVLGMYTNWQFISSRLRIETERYQSYTLSSYFERRLSDESGMIRLSTAVMTIFFLTWYLSAALIGMGLLFESVFGINYYTGLVIAVTVGVSYTFYGGYITVAWTDLCQGAFLLAVILAVPVLAFVSLPNGATTIQEHAQAAHISLQLLPSESFSFLLGAVFTASWGLGYWGQPHILTKFMGIDDVKQMAKAKYVGMSWQIIALGCSTLIGLIGIGFFTEGTIQNSELLFIEIVKVLFHPFVAGIVLCAIVAATMSTMDSQILVSASVFSEDLYGRFFNRHATEKQKVLVSRLGVVLTAFVALLIAFKKSSSVMDSVEYAWMGLGSTFGPLLLLCLYSKTVTRTGGICGIIVGGVLSATWHLANPYITELVIPRMLPAFAGSIVSIFLVSKIERLKVSH